MTTIYLISSSNDDDFEGHSKILCACSTYERAKELVAELEKEQQVLLQHAKMLQAITSSIYDESYRKLLGSVATSTGKVDTTIAQALRSYHDMFNAAVNKYTETLDVVGVLSGKKYEANDLFCRSKRSFYVEETELK